MWRETHGLSAGERVGTFRTSGGSPEHAERPRIPGSGLLFGGLFLSSGASLLVYILSGLGLGVTFAVVLGAAIPAGLSVWRRSSEARRSELRLFMRAGIISGLLATGAYDIARCLLVQVAGFTFWPFDVFTFFGQALLGTEDKEIWVTIAGFLYHLANGIGFALSYVIWLGRRGVVAGLGWALMLELFMVSFYPGWLGLKALDEFLQVSIFGHIVYGSTLGYTSKCLLS